MNLVQLIYVSRPFGFDQAALNGILSQSRRCNTRDGVTGALICRSDIYLQLLEGTVEALDATYERIVADDRHLEINRLSYQAITERLFPAWAMRSDPARSWMWSPAEVANGAVAESTQKQLIGIFERLAAEPAEGASLSAV
ncbi:MAG: BLUF domain-containing protein [Methylobacterium sp.]|uniref:BLUF domain-containing protein n=1 Tax=Methylobacterium sp. TaxID=409 RepID=UPI0025F108EC|nr:BLUF domain-containing protein [Methylobacterium sp.]MBX9930176.1 BLUF domain-containing protein [Methylobacterium sp.]